MSTVEKKKNPNRPITGLLSSTYTAQHAILSLSLLFLLLSPASAQPPPNGAVPQQYQRFTPSMAIIIVILIAALFIMGFFSIYIRRCSENADGSISRLGALGASIRGRRAAAARGLDPAVIETFPTFVYSVVKGLKIGNGALECAVCLNEFEDDETLRLIPKCDHVFHPECIDAWLESHVTCPVCRANLVPQPGETIQVFPDLNTESEPDNPQNNDDVSIRISDDHDVSEQEPPPPVVRRNLSSNQNRPPRSRSVRSMLFGKFPRSHSTGHSLVQPGENMDRFTLRLPEDLRKEVMNRRLNRTTSCVVVLPRETSSRRGYRTGGGEGSRNYRQLEPPLDRGVRSDRWVFSMAPPFFSRASSVRSPKGVVAATSSTTPKGSVTAVKTPFNFLEPKGDESGVESARHPV